jgi:hypothetical protein
MMPLVLASQQLMSCMCLPRVTHAATVSEGALSLSSCEWLPRTVRVQRTGSDPLKGRPWLHVCK